MRKGMLRLAFAAGFFAHLMAAAPPARAQETRPPDCDTPTPNCRAPSVKKAELAPPAAPEAEAAGGGAIPATGAAGGDAVLPALPLPVPTPFGAAAVKLADRKSYEDAYGILSRDNSCSRFFGGPAFAVEVLNSFALRLRRKHLGDGELAIRMSGDYDNYRNLRTGGAYRLFKEASLNTAGPFSRRAEVGATAREQVIGRFPARSRQGRALVLLHEMGHLIRGPGGAWLLPNDGRDAAQSARNTLAVEARCVEQLLALGR
jgi:hypothetical protein